MENSEKYKANDRINIIELNMVKLTITDSNKARLHEIVRELLRLGALDKIDAEGLLVCCEIL
jgi:hypothetical protein